MKNGRINERNYGHWTLDGEPKHLKHDKCIIEDFEDLPEELIVVKDLLQSTKNNYYTYYTWNMKNKILNDLFFNGIIEKGIRKSKWFNETQEICIVKDIDALLQILNKYKNIM